MHFRLLALQETAEFRLTIACLPTEPDRAQGEPADSPRQEPENRGDFALREQWLDEPVVAMLRATEVRITWRLHPKLGRQRAGLRAVGGVEQVLPQWDVDVGVLGPALYRYTLPAALQ